MIKAIIFDLDGVVIDSEPIAYSLLQELVNPYGYTITLEEYTTEFLGRTVLAGIQRIRNMLHTTESEEELLCKYFSMEEEKIKSGIPLKPGVNELLLYLKDNGYKTIVASSSVRKRAEDILDSHNLSVYFDDMVFGYEVERGKPFPDIFLKACEKLGVKEDEAIVIEDSEAGIQAAFSADIPVICIPDIKAPNEEFLEKASYVFDSLYDVITFLEKTK